MDLKKIPVLLDVDTGVDDALAMVLACASDKLDILGVCAVAGNVALAYTLPNTMNVLHLLGRDDIPVAKGADGPLSRPLFSASGVHGINGLRGYNFEEDYTGSLVEANAWDFMAEKIAASSEKVTILALGPLTNIAKLLMEHPESKANIDRIVFMGTSWHDGNPTPIATFNVLVDPEALDYVLKSGVEFYACPLDTTRGAILTGSEIDSIKEISGPAAALSYGILHNYGKISAEEFEAISKLGNEESLHKLQSETIGFEDDRRRILHDPATVAFVTNPELFTYTKYYCEVECAGTVTRGFTLVDKANWYQKTEQEKNLYFMDSIDRDGFARVFLEAVAHYGK